MLVKELLNETGITDIPNRILSKGNNVLINFHRIYNNERNSIRGFKTSDDMVKFLKKNDAYDLKYGEMRTAITVDKLTSKDSKTLGLPDGFKLSLDKNNLMIYKNAIDKLSNRDYLDLDIVKGTFMNSDNDSDNYDWQIAILNGKKLEAFKHAQNAVIRDRD